MSKSAELKFHHEAGCLIVTATGRYLLEHKEEATKAIAAAIKAHSAKAALVDMRGLKRPITFMDRYRIGEMAGRYLTSVPVIALATPQDIDPGKIGMVVANNRGAKVEIFSDEAAAFACLKKYQAAVPGPLTTLLADKSTGAGKSIGRTR